MPAATASPKPAQHMTALKRANDVRLARAKLKHHVNDGTITVADVIADVPDCASSMTLAELLCSQRRWGATRARKNLAGIALPETKTVESMTLRQRALLINLLGFGDSAAYRRVEILARADRRHRESACSRLNGAGPCLRPAGHGGPCVRGVHAPALGLVHFRNGITDEWIASAEVPLGAPLPAPSMLSGLLAVALRQDRGTLPA